MAGHVPHESVGTVALCGLGTALFFLDIETPLGVADGVGYAALLTASSWVPGRRPTTVLAVVYSILIVAGHVLGEGGVGDAALVNRFIALLSLWIVAAIIVERKTAEVHARAGGEELGRLVRLLMPRPTQGSNPRTALVERSIWAVAHLHVKRHGADALLHAQSRAAERLAAGDDEGYATWVLITDAIEALLEREDADRGPHNLG